MINNLHAEPNTKEESDSIKKQNKSKMKFKIDKYLVLPLNSTSKGS